MSGGVYEDPRLGLERAAFMAFLVSAGESSQERAPSRSASPSASRRLSTTGHFLQRGRLLQQRFFVVIVVEAMRSP
jgi:hypothetical protein